MSGNGRGTPRPESGNREASGTLTDGPAAAILPGHMSSALIIP